MASLHTKAIQGVAPAEPLQARRSLEKRLGQAEAGLEPLPEPDDRRLPSEEPGDRWLWSLPLLLLLAMTSPMQAHALEIHVQGMQIHLLQHRLPH